jgi:hypothetical protein
MVQIMEQKCAEIRFIIYVHLQPHISPNNSPRADLLRFAAMLGETIWPKVRGEKGRRRPENRVCSRAVARGNHDSSRGRAVRSEKIIDVAWLNKRKIKR